MAKYNLLACLFFYLFAYKLPSCVDTFITAVYHNIKNSLAKPVLKNNLTKSERKALKTCNSEMVLSLLIMDVEDYIKEANRQISHISGIAHRKN